MVRIRLDSRYKDVETIYTCLNKNSGIITSNSAYVRTTVDSDNNLVSIDFEGGPMLNIGDTLPIFKKKIKNIKRCYYIELE